MAEARGLHVAESRLAERVAEGSGPFVVWDVGLGAAANAIAAIEVLAEEGGSREIEMHSFDRTPEPLEFAANHAGELGYLREWLAPVRELIANGTAQIGNVCWKFHRGDFCEIVREQPAPAPHAILYDPYSPRVNPGMWTLEHFTRLRRCLGPANPCTLTSYSRSTAVRVTLLLAGFFVGRGRATGEKDQTTVAATHRELLHDPIGSEWLGRVRRSTRGGPLREGRPGGPISSGEYAALVARIG